MISVGKVLNVPTYDWCRHAQYLFAILVKLEETFGASSCPVSLLSKCPMMGLPARRFCFCCSLNTFKSYSSSFGKKRTSTLLSGVLTRQNRVLAFTSSPSSAMMCTGKTGECQAIENILQNVCRQILNHLLCQSKTFENAVRHFFSSKL